MTQRKTAQDLAPDCSVRLHCRACRASHVLKGPIRPGRHVGDVVVGGHTFSVEDIEIIWNAGDRGGRRAPALPWRLAEERTAPMS
jgi:hypothetical protein